MNRSYPLADQKFASGSINWTSDTIEALLLTSAYTFSLTHEFEANLSGIITRQTLTSKTNVEGVLDAADIDFTDPGSTVNAVVVLKQTGSAATAPLLFYFDVGSGLPRPSDGNSFKLIWPGATTYKIYAIGGQR